MGGFRLEVKLSCCYRKPPDFSGGFFISQRAGSNRAIVGGSLSESDMITIILSESDKILRRFRTKDLILSTCLAIPID